MCVALVCLPSIAIFTTSSDKTKIISFSLSSKRIRTFASFRVSKQIEELSFWCQYAHFHSVGSVFFKLDQLIKDKDL